MWMGNNKAAIVVHGKVIAMVPVAFMKKHERITRRRVIGNLAFAVYSLGFLDYYEWAHPTWHGLQIYFAFMGALLLLLGIDAWRNMMKITVNRALVELHKHRVKERKKRERNQKVAS